MRGQAPENGIPPLLWALLASLAALLLGFSQTAAYFGDEGFHLLAARLVNAGKRLYLDFFYPHAPLYAYLIAACMRVVGDTWRSVHALSALLTSTSTVLLTSYVFSRSHGSGWQLATAASAALLMGLNSLVIWYGTIGQAFGLSLLLSIVAYLLVVESVDRPGGPRPFLAGLSAGTAAASLLLTAPIAPILFLWLLRHTASGYRFKKGAHFLAGVMLPFFPLLWFIAHGPREVLFNVVGYHVLYRATWAARSEAVRLSLNTLASWLNSTQALILILLAMVALTFLARRDEWDERRRREFRLCGWLTTGLVLFLAIPLPTYPHYFILVVPFASILAVLGLNMLGSRLWPSVPPLYVVMPLLALYSLGLVKATVQLRWTFYTPQWGVVEDVAREINRITPEDGPVYAQEVVLVAARRLPPPGMENAFGSVLRRPTEQLARLHIVPEAEIDRRLAAGYFHTAVIGVTDPRVQELGLLRRYAHQEQLHRVYILSDPVADAPYAGQP